MNATLTILATATLALLAACSAMAQTADPASDAPEGRSVGRTPLKDASSYEQALQLWRSAEDINAWIDAKFEYDVPRAIRLSETQRSGSARFPIHSPQDFFASPRGVCVDLSRFAVEALLVIDPKVRPAYLMIEFVPVTIAGNTLRLHWIATFERDGKHYFFADSKRPGYIAGPYASTREFIVEYARYRSREIVAFRELESYERKQRTLATRQNGEERP